MGPPSQPLPPLRDGSQVIMASDGKRYRKTVCCVIMDFRGNILGCQRWRERFFQCVQGGMNQGETERETAYRETMEEIGIPGELLTYVGSLRDEVVALYRADNPPSAHRSDEEVGEEALCYVSKSWRSERVVGQQLQPVLAFISTSSADQAVFAAHKEERREVGSVTWMLPWQLLPLTPPAKLRPMYYTVRAAVEKAKYYLLEHHYIDTSDPLFVTRAPSLEVTAQLCDRATAPAEASQKKQRHTRSQKEGALPAAQATRTAHRHTKRATPAPGSAPAPAPAKAFAPTPPAPLE